MGNITFTDNIARINGHSQLQANLSYSSLTEATNALDGAAWVAIGDIVTITSSGSTKMYYVNGTLSADKKTLTNFELVPLASGGDAASSGDVKNLREAVGVESGQSVIDIIDYSAAGTDRFSGLTTVVSALTDILNLKIEKQSKVESANTNTYELKDLNGTVLSSFDVDKDRYLSSVTVVTSYTSGGTVISGNAIEMKFQTYDATTSAYTVSTVDLPVKDLIGIDKPLSSVTINGVSAWTIDNFNETISISGHNIEIGAFVEPDNLYAEWEAAYSGASSALTASTRFSAVTKVSGDTTIASGFSAVEKTIDALAGELIDDEQVIQAAISTIVSGTGLIDSDGKIGYSAVTTSSTLSGASSLYQADILLDQAIKSAVAGQVKISSTDDLAKLVEITTDASGSGSTMQYVSSGATFDCGTI